MPAMKNNSGITCHYLDEQTYEKLFHDYEEIFAMLQAMGEKASAFCSKG
jgi:hypothetical protein